MQERLFRLKVFLLLLFSIRYVFLQLDNLFRVFFNYCGPSRLTTKKATLERQSSAACGLELCATGPQTTCG